MDNQNDGLAKGDSFLYMAIFGIYDYLLKVA